VKEPTALLDLFAVESMWTEEQRMVRDSVRGFSRNVFEPRVARCYLDETFPDDLIPQIGALGVLGANLTGYGCAGLDATAYGLIMRELEYVDSGLRSFASVQGALCMYPIWQFGSEAQKEKFLPRMATGELIGCFGLTEPDSGSVPGSMTHCCVSTSTSAPSTGSPDSLTTRTPSSPALGIGSGGSSRSLKTSPRSMRTRSPSVVSMSSL